MVPLPALPSWWKLTSMQVWPAGALVAQERSTQVPTRVTCASEAWSSPSRVTMVPGTQNSPVVGEADGEAVGEADGEAVGVVVGAGVGARVGAPVGQKLRTRKASDSGKVWTVQQSSVESQQLPSQRAKLLQLAACSQRAAQSAAPVVVPVSVCSGQAVLVPRLTKSRVGADVGELVGALDGDVVGLPVGARVGEVDGAGVGEAVQVTVSARNCTTPPDVAECVQQLVPT